MASRPCACESNRLRLSLEDRLSEAHQAELADHLEGCPACRRELEQMAAASRFWGDAALLRGEPAPGASPTVGLRADGGPEVEDEDEAGDVDAGWREFLDPPDPSCPDTIGRVGPYEILEVLGRGGMGVVLKARDPALDRTVAIKLLSPTFSRGATARRRFAREARAVAAVGHEHIVAIHAVDEFRGLPYLVMQYVPGRSLQERIDATGPLEVREILRIGTQAARALAAAHAQGVVHRDIKPANILLENCIERVKLTDFGLARAIDDASLTQSGVIAGTPQYMAPEQARGEPVDARADLFALGGALYAMAAGRSPFRADSTMAVLKRVCEARHRPIRELNSDVPDWLEATIDRLLAKEPDDRFQSATEVADLLEKGLAHLQQPAILPPPFVARVNAHSERRLDLDIPVPMQLPHARRRLPLVAALFLLSVAGLGASEALGLTQVTDFVATILRIKTPDGTLVIKVTDPAVKVQIDNDTVVIGDAGPQEIRLRAGNHRVQAIKDGKAVHDQLVTINRGGKEIVNVDFEPAETAIVAETKNSRDMSAPRSHVNQCMNCHSNVRALKADEPLPPNHPTLYAGTASANAHTVSTRCMGAECIQGTRHGLESRFLAGRAQSGDWPARHRPAPVNPPDLGPGATPGHHVVPARRWLSERGLLAGWPKPWPRGTSTGLCQRSYSPTNGRIRDGERTTKTRVRPSIPSHSFPAARFRRWRLGRLGPVPWSRHDRKSPTTQVSGQDLVPRRQPRWIDSGGWGRSENGARLRPGYTATQGDTGWAYSSRQVARLFARRQVARVGRWQHSEGMGYEDVGYGQLEGQRRALPS